MQNKRSNTTVENVKVVKRYEDLKPCYIIFICMKNPFPEAGLHKYTFRNVCDEMPNLDLGDGAVKVFLAAEGTADDISDEMKGFLAFLTNRQSRTDLTRRLAEEVDKARRHERWKVEYMTLLERDERMREEGQKRRLVMQVCKKLVKGKTPQEIAEALEEDISEIREICDVAAGFAPEYREDDVWAAILDEH